jgi:probable rRNA maturation factor
MTLTLTNRQRDRKINARLLKEIAGALLAELGGPAATLEIALVSPARMAKVNQAFLGHEGPTDVITFDYREEEAIQMPGEGVHHSSHAKPGARPARTLKRPEGRAPGIKREDAGAAWSGELFICPAVAVAQAREFGTDWRSELVRYVIHGLLHLQGHDDQEPAARRRMKRAEGRWLKLISRRFALSKL